jgi:hypothetical protein
VYTRVFAGLLLRACALLYGADSSAMTATESDGSGISVTKFGDDLAFLRKHTETIVLSDENEAAELVVAPVWQGRVMTSTAQGVSGRSLGWINRKHIAAGKIVPHINLFGGEERFWLGPEGGQFSIFHGKDGGFGWDNWQVPPPLDSLPFQTVGHSRDRATFRAGFSLTNYSGTVFRVEVRREVRLLSTKEAWSHLGLLPPEHVSLVAYESTNTLTNAGKMPWRKETGLLSIWIPGMLPASPTAIFIAPIKPGPQSELGVGVTSDYFHTPGPDRLKLTADAVYFRVDAGYQSKIGISPARSLGKFGSWDPERHLLTVVQFSQPAGVSEYVKSKWQIQKDPYAGDAINGYNDGATEPGAETFGPFYEMESSSPAAALAPGESIEHTHRTIHLIGPDRELDKIARVALGISLKAMPQE